MVKASIVSKETHLSTTVEDVNGYILNVASVVKLEVQAEQVLKIKLVNGDLVIELINGEVITIENFNDGTKNLDNSLVLLNGTTLLHINLPANGDKEVNPQIDYLALGEVDTLLHHNDGDSNLLPWIIAGGAIAVGGIAAAVGSSGSSGKDGKDGVNGKDGQDALNIFYDYASSNGFTGTQNELVEIIMSEGLDGLSAYEVAQSMGYTGTVEEWLISLQGAVGADGKSAYQIAKDNGFVGSETEWLASLSGKDGKNLTLLDMPIVKSDVDGVITGLAAPGVTISLYDSKGKVVATTIADENGNWTLPNTLAPNQIGQLIASDSNGSVSLPLPIINIVDTTPLPEVVKPTLELVGVEKGIISGTATPGVTINLYNSKGKVIGTVEVDADGHWSMENTLPANEIGTVIAIDAKGNISLPLPILELSKPEVISPEVIQTTGVPKITEADIALKGKAEAGAKITVLQNGNVIAETTADQDGNWSFEINPLPVGSYGGVYASVEGKHDSSSVIVNGFVLHPTDQPVVLESTTKLSGTSQAGAKIKVFNASTNEYFETTADENGEWSFEVNPLGNGEYGSVTAQLEHHAESGKVDFIGPELVKLDQPTITYNDEDGLMGETEPFANIFIIDSNGVEHSTTADENGVWKFEYNPAFENLVDMIASKKGFQDSYPYKFAGQDSVAPKLSVDLGLKQLTYSLESNNKYHSGSIIIKYKDGSTKFHYVEIETGSLSDLVDLNGIDTNLIESAEFWVSDRYSNNSEVIDITHVFQNFTVSSASLNLGYTGQGLSNSVMEVTHKGTGQKFIVHTDENGVWNIPKDDLIDAGISIVDSNNEFSAKYLEIKGQETKVDADLESSAPAALPLINVEVLEHNFGYMILKSDPNTYLQLVTLDPFTGNTVQSYKVYVDSEGSAKVNLAYYNGTSHTLDYKLVTTNANGDTFEVISEQLYVRVSTDELILKVEGNAYATYEIECNGVKSQFTTDGNGVYQFIPNPYANKMFTIDRIDTIGDKDIPPQEFGAVVKEPIILGVLDGHLVFDVPLQDYTFKIYDENGNVIMDLSAGFKSGNSHIHDINAIKQVIEGHQHGFTDVFLNSNFVDGQKYYLEYTNTKSGGVSGKQEFILGENGTVPNFTSESSAPSISWNLNSGIMQWSFNYPDADKVVIKVNGVVQSELDLFRGYLKTGTLIYPEHKVYEVEVYKNGELVKTEHVDTSLAKPDVLVQGMDDRYIWGKATGASYVVVTIGEGSSYYNASGFKQYSIPVGADGKFLIDTFLTQFKGYQLSCEIYGVGESYNVSQTQTLYIDSTNGNTIKQHGVTFSTDYDTMYLNYTSNSDAQNFKIIDFKTGEIVLELSHTSAVENGINIGQLDSGMYRIVVERAHNEFEELQLYINEDGKAYTTFELPTTGYHNTVYDILNYADDLGGNHTTTFDLAASPDHHFNVHELLAHDYDSSKNLSDFLSAVTTTDSETGQTSTSIFIDRDGAGDKFESTELLILQNTDLTLEQLLNNGTILY